GGRDAFDLDRLLSGPLAGPGVLEHRLADPALAGPFRPVDSFAAGALEEQLHQLLDHFRPSPENVESLVENDRMLVTAHQYRMERPVEIGAVGERALLRRIDGVEHLARPDRQAALPQETRKVHDIVGEPSLRLKPRLGHHPSPVPPLLLPEPAGAMVSTS